MTQGLPFDGNDVAPEAEVQAKALRQIFDERFISREYFDIHFEDVQKRLGYVEKRIDETNERITDLKNDVNKRFDGANKSFENVNKEFDKTNKGIDDLKNDINKRFEDTNNNFNEKINNLENRLLVRLTLTIGTIFTILFGLSKL